MFLWHRDHMNFTRRSWYLLAIAVPLIAWIIGSAQLASRWDVVHEAKPLPIGGNFDAADQSVAIFTDFVQADRIITCSVTRPKDQAREIDKPAVDISVNFDATRWHFIGFTPEGHDKMRVSCVPEDGHTDGSTYAYAVVPSTFDTEMSAHFIMWGGLGFGFLISLVIGYARYNALIRSE